MMKVELTGSVQPKNGRLYAVMQYKNKDGKRISKWKALGLDEGALQSKVNKALRQTMNAFEEELSLGKNNEYCAESEMSISDFMKNWLEENKRNIQRTTYTNYRIMINGRIYNYFSQKPNIRVATITAKDIQEFYDSMFAENCTANTVIHYHAILRKAFSQAVKNETIAGNPFDKVERPKKNKFVGDHYSEEELKTLLKLTREDVIYPAIVLAGCMGLRRSEALGVRWSRINLEEGYMLLDTKVVSVKDESGKGEVLPVEEMKNVTSKRTLPIPQQVMEMLYEQKRKRELYIKLFKSSYNREFEDYVCVNELGELLNPGYVSGRFFDLLGQYGLRKIRFHDLRHTFASILINKDVPLINVSNFLGHSDVSTTANIYAHFDKSSKLKSVSVINDMFKIGKEEN